MTLAIKTKRISRLSGRYAAFLLICSFLGSAGRVLADSPVNVTVLANQPIYAMHEGYGANVTSISSSIIVDRYHGKVGSAYCLLPDANDDAHWKSIFHYMNWSGLDWIRLLIEMNDYEPQKDYFTWNSPNFRRARKILDWAQKNGVDVLLQQQDQCTTWNSIPGQDPAYSAPRDLKAFAMGYAKMVQFFVSVKGYTCIKMLNISNEPGNWWGWWKGGDIKDGYQAAREALNASGLHLPLVGTEYFEGGNYNANWNACKGFLGAWENHNYAESQRNVYSQRPIDDPAYPVYWGEFGGGDNTNYDWDITVAKWFVGSANNGMDGFARWSYLNQNDIDGDFSFIRTYDIVNKRLLNTYSPTKNLYCIDGIVSRYTAKYSTVYATASDDPKITPTLFVSPNGAYTLIVINEEMKENSDVTFHFQGLGTHKLLYRYQVTPIDVKNKNGNADMKSTRLFSLSSSSSTFKDILSPNSIYVYTTYHLLPTDRGIVSDGDFKPVTTKIALLHNHKIWGIADNHLRYNGVWKTDFDLRDIASHAKYTGEPGASCLFSFRGSNFRLYGHQDNGSCLASIYIDGHFAGYANNYAPLRQSKMMIFDSGKLRYGAHTVKVANEGIRTITGNGSYINIESVGIN
jgi:hypothetical protein